MAREFLVERPLLVKSLRRFWCRIVRRNEILRLFCGSRSRCAFRNLRSFLARMFSGLWLDSRRVRTFVRPLRFIRPQTRGASPRFNRGLDGASGPSQCRAACRRLTSRRCQFARIRHWPPGSAALCGQIRLGDQVAAHLNQRLDSDFARSLCGFWLEHFLLQFITRFCRSICCRLGESFLGRKQLLEIVRSRWQCLGRDWRPWHSLGS